MADINLDKGKTMLLMADFSTSGIGQNPIAKERQTLERAREVLDAARSAGVFVGYCISHFRPGFPEVSDRNKTRAARRDSGEVLPADPAMLIHRSVQPNAGEPVIAKHRTSAFSGSAFEMILRAHNIETLILMGHATSGVILSTVRLAADLDYHLIVVEDGCADRDPEVHKLLMEKVFPRQATVVSSKDMVEALAALSGV
jgi:nicotinamidase-related amidase